MASIHPVARLVHPLQNKVGFQVWFISMQVVYSLEKSHRHSIDTAVRPPTEAIGADCGRKTRHRKVDGGGIVQEEPGAPRSFQIQSCDGRPLAAFQF